MSATVELARYRAHAVGKIKFQSTKNLYQETALHPLTAANQPLSIFSSSLRVELLWQNAYQAKCPMIYITSIFF